MSRSERAAHRPSTRLWPARLALFGAIAVLVVVSVVARLVLAPDLVRAASRLAHGSSAWMFTAGWATAFVPAAVLIFLVDGNRRERQLGDNPLNRPRGAHGHAVPGRGSGYWMRRLPLLLPILLAVVFAPSRAGSAPVDWHATPSGGPFHRGWHLSFLIALPALMALLTFRLAALLSESGDRLLRVAGPLTAATPALALLGLSPFIH